jgi:hypothetical protein
LIRDPRRPRKTKEMAGMRVAPQSLLDVTCH